MRGIGLGAKPRASVAPMINDPYQAKNSFFFVTNIDSSLAPAASLTSSFTLTADADFIWTKMNFYAQVASDGTSVSAQELPGVTLIITNTSSGRNYMNAATPLAAIAGSGGLPFLLPMQTLWEATTTIQVTYANITDNKTYTQLYLVFIGIKCYLKNAGG